MLRCFAVGRKQSEGNRVCQTVRDFLAGLLLFLAVFFLAAMDAGPARPQTAATTAAQSAHASQKPPSLTPTQMRSGSLLIRPDAATKREGLSQAQPLDTDVSINVDGPVARAHVTQVFKNTLKRRADGIFVFPLPEQAAVDSLRIQVGERAITGEIVPRSKAQALFERTLQAGADARRFELGHGNMFTSAVANIAPGETVTVQITYQQMLRFADGHYSLHFPLVSTPRYARKPLTLGVRYDSSGPDRVNGAPAGDKGKDDRSYPVSLQVRLQAGFPLGEIASTSYPIEVKRLGEDGALLTLRNERVRGDKDFTLTWAPVATKEPVAHLFRQGFGTSEYLLAAITPPTVGTAIAKHAREVVFVVDTSGSMAGSAIAQARKSLELAISRLDEIDRFNIIAFDSSYEALFKKPVPADADGKAIAKQFIARLVASGGTEIIRPLSAALKDEQADDSTRVRQVVLITDGAIKNGQKLFSEIAVKRGRSRLFLIGIGPEPNDSLLRRAAEVGRGSEIHIASQKDLGARMDRFLKRLERPAMTDVRIEWPKEARAEAWPDPLPDLYAGEPLVITARTETALKGKVRISGVFNGKVWSKQLDPAAATKGDGIAKAWARNKIASLASNTTYVRADSGNVGAQIEKIALEHQLVSGMTSLVSIDRTPPRPSSDGTPLASEEVPMTLPEGWAYDGFSGERAASGDVPMAGKGYSVTSQVNGHGRNRTRVVALPQASKAVTPTVQDAAVPADREASISSGAALQTARAGGANSLIGAAPLEVGPATTSSFLTGRMGVIFIMAVVFAAMSALTLGLWRQLGRGYSSERRTRRGA